MDKGTLKSAAEFSIVTAATLGMIAFSFAKMGIGSDFADIIVVNFIGAGFVVIGLACAPFLLISKEHFICGLKDLALPIGLIMACCACFVQMSDLNQSFSIGAILPAVAGGMISLTLADAEVPKRIVPLNKFKCFLSWFWIICVCFSADTFLGGDPRWNLVHWETWFLCLFVVHLFCLYNPKKFIVFQRISFGAIAAMILAVSLSTVGVGVASQETDMNIYGNSMVLGLIGTMYGCWIYITSLLIGRLRFHYDVDSNRSNWHLAEIFTFFIILNMGPKTMFEVWDDSKIVQTEETALEASSTADKPGNDI